MSDWQIIATSVSLTIAIQFVIRFAWTLYYKLKIEPHQWPTQADVDNLTAERDAFRERHKTTLDAARQRKAQ